MEINRLIFVANHKITKSAEVNYWLLSFANSSKGDDDDAVHITPTVLKCVVKAHKVQTVKLKLYKCKS